MPIFKQKGLFLWGEENTSIKSIVKALHQHLLYLEQINFKDNIEYDVDFEELIRDVESEKY
jgi:predicted metal-dependent hydrolase